MARWIIVSILLTLMISGPIYLPRVTGSSAPPPTDTTTPTATVTPTPTPLPPQPPGVNIDCQVVGAVQVCASISNDSPARYTNVTAYGRLIVNGAPVAGASVHTTWHYRTTTPTEDCVTGGNGIGHCTRNIGGAAPGYTVRVDVQVTYAGYPHTAQTWFTP